MLIELCVIYLLPIESISLSLAPIDFGWSKSKYANVSHEMWMCVSEFTMNVYRKYTQTKIHTHTAHKPIRHSYECCVESKWWPNHYSGQRTMHTPVTT